MNSAKDGGFIIMNTIRNSSRQKFKFKNLTINELKRPAKRKMEGDNSLISCFYFFCQPVTAAARGKGMSANTPKDKENRERPLTKASSIPNLAVSSKIPLVNRSQTPVERVKRPLKAMNT